MLVTELSELVDEPFLMEMNIRGHGNLVVLCGWLGRGLQM